MLPTIRKAESVDWTYEDVTEELYHLAMIEDLEPAGPALPELPSPPADDEIARAVEDLRTVAELEGR